MSTGLLGTIEKIEQYLNYKKRCYNLQIKAAENHEKSENDWFAKLLDWMEKSNDNKMQEPDRPTPSEYSEQNNYIVLAKSVLEKKKNLLDSKYLHTPYFQF
jgi:hypothetical protein